MVPGVIGHNLNPEQIRSGRLKPGQSAVAKPTATPRPNQPRLIPFHATIKQNLQQIPDIQKKLQD